MRGWRRAAWLVGLLALAGCGDLSYEGLERNEPPAPLPVAQAAIPGGQAYTVVAGDSVDRVARQFSVPVRALIEANGLVMPYELRAGERLEIPGGTAGMTGKEGGIYVVSAGDNLYRIAQDHGTTVAVLAELNGLAPPYAISIGQQLRLPGTPATPSARRTASAATGEISSLLPATPAPMAPNAPPKVTTEALPPPPGLAAQPIPTPPPPASASAAPPPSVPQAPAPLAPAPLVPAPSSPALSAKPAPKLAVVTPKVAPVETAGNGVPPAPPAGSLASLPQPVPRGSGKFLWPVNGKVVSPFGPKDGGQHNDGINIAAPLGTPVRAAGDGVVVYAGNELRGFGNLLLVRHAGGWISAYAHCEALLVKRGDHVRRGEVIARVGRTGNVDSPQLHFELRKGAEPVDPLTELGSQGA